MQWRKKNPQLIKGAEFDWSRWSLSNFCTESNAHTTSQRVIFVIVHKDFQARLKYSLDRRDQIVNGSKFKKKVKAWIPNQTPKLYRVFNLWHYPTCRGIYKTKLDQPNCDLFCLLDFYYVFIHSVLRLCTLLLEIFSDTLRL